MEWNFQKGDYNINVSITPSYRCSLCIGKDIEVYAELVQDRNIYGLAFDKNIRLSRDGKLCDVSGFSIEKQMYDEISREIKNQRIEDEKQRKIQQAKKEAEHKQLYDEYMSGNRPIELVETVDSEFWAITVFQPKNEVVYNVLNDLKCISYQWHLNRDLYPKVDTETMTISIKHCREFYEKTLANEKARKIKTQQEELLKPEIQYFTEETETGINAIVNSNVGDVITRNYCKYRVIGVTLDVDYPTLRHIACKRIGKQDLNNQIK